MTAGDRLRQLVAALGVEYGLERSIKLRRGTVLANRFLLTIAKSSVAGADTTLRGLCERLNMSAAFLGAVEEHLPEANIVHFGFEEEPAGRSFFKFYLERQDPFERIVAASSGPVGPFLLHRAFKWNVRDNTEQVVARYVCCPHLAREAILQRVAQVYARQAERTPWDVLCQILGAASRRIPTEDMLYLEVEEDGTSRRSFDLNVYRAGFAVSALERFLGPLCGHYAIAPDCFQQAYAGIESLPLGHVAGGVDRQGRDFFTIYFGVEAHG